MGNDLQILKINLQIITFSKLLYNFKKLVLGKGGYFDKRLGILIWKLKNRF